MNHPVAVLRFDFPFLSGSVDWKPTKQLNNRLSPEPPALSEEQIREIMDRESVWVSDPGDGFVRGRIVDIGEDGATVEPVDRKKKPVVARYVCTETAIRSARGFC